MIRAVIIDDEINSRELLEQLLETYCSEITVVGMADDVSSGIELINKNNPDLVFLDVEMPGGTGFDILRGIENITFNVIFVTGYDHYAIKAIKFSALDYLLKPIDIEELQQAVKKIGAESINTKDKVDFLQDKLDQSNESLDQFVLSGTKNHLVLKIDDITYVESKGSYVTFYVGNKKHVSLNPLSSYDDIFSKSSMFRIHKSYIINCKEIVKVDIGRGGYVHLSDGTVLPIAMRRKSSFLRFLDDLS